MVSTEAKFFWLQKLKSPSPATWSSPTGGQVGWQTTKKRGWEQDRLTSMNILFKDLKPILLIFAESKQMSES